MTLRKMVGNPALRRGLAVVCAVLMVGAMVTVPLASAAVTDITEDSDGPYVEGDNVDFSFTPDDDIEDVQIWLDDGSGEYSDGDQVKTIDNGSLTAGETYFGSFSLDADTNADDYQLAAIQSDTLSAGDVAEETTTMFAVEEETTSFDVTVEDQDANAIEGATVDIIDPADGSVVASQDSDADGVAAFADIETGDYDVEIAADGYLDASYFGVTVDSTTSSLTFAMTPSAVVEFSVVDGDTALEGAEITLDDTEFDVTRTVETDADGVAEIEVAQGEWNISIAHGSYAEDLTADNVEIDGNKLVSADFGASDDEEAVTIEAVEDEEETEGGGVGLPDSDDFAGGVAVGLVVALILGFFAMVRE